MSTITTIASSDLITNSRAVINTNFSNLNTDKIETSVIDTDSTLAANSDTKLPSQKAVKTYVDTLGNVNASTVARGIVEEATAAETAGGTTTGATGARLFVNPSSITSLFVGTMVPYVGRSAPTGWLLCDGTAYSRATYSSLFAIIAPSQTFTVTIATPAVFSKVAHGLLAGDKISLTTTGALPTGLSANTDYFVISAGLTADAFEVSASRGGAAVNTSGSQSGTHTLYASNHGKGDGSTTFNVPDMRGMTPYGYKSSDANFDTLNTPNTYAGEKTHQLITAELPAHTHPIPLSNAVAGSGHAVSEGNNTSATPDTSGSTGSDTAHNNLPPYLVMNWIVKY